MAALITDEEDIFNTARILRNYGQSQRYLHSEVGMNSRLDEIQAAILKVRLGCQEKLQMMRRKIAET